MIFIGFKAPSITPTTEDKLTAFAKLPEVAIESRAGFFQHIGQIAKRFVNLSTQSRMCLKEEVVSVFEELQQEVHPRLLTGYSNLLYMIKEV